MWQVRAAVDALAEEESTVVRMQHFEGYSLEEIGARLGIPVGTVKSRAHRAHRHIAAALRPQEEVSAR